MWPVSSVVSPAEQASGHTQLSVEQFVLYPEIQDIPKATPSASFVSFLDLSNLLRVSSCSKLGFSLEVQLLRGTQ